MPGPLQNLAANAKYVLRFKATSSTYDPNTGELSSPGFIVLRAAPSTTSPSSPSTSSKVTTSASTSFSPFGTIATETTLSPSQTSLAEQHFMAGGLSNGAKAGLGISVAVVAFGVSGILYGFLRRQRRDVIPTEAIGNQVDYKNGSTTHLAELPGTWPAADLATEMAVRQ